MHLPLPAGCWVLSSAGALGAACVQPYSGTVARSRRSHGATATATTAATTTAAAAAASKLQADKQTVAEQQQRQIQTQALDL